MGIRRVFNWEERTSVGKWSKRRRSVYVCSRLKSSSSRAQTSLGEERGKGRPSRILIGAQLESYTCKFLLKTQRYNW